MVYVHLRNHFSSTILKQIGIDEGDSFYNHIREFNVNKMEDRYLVRLNEDMEIVTQFLFQLIFKTKVFFFMSDKGSFFRELKQNTTIR